MILYVRENANGEYEVKDVNQTNDTTLIPLLISDENNPFLTWTPAKICCYKVEVTDGIVTMFTPYVPWVVVEQIDRQGRENISLQAQVDYISMMTDIEL